MPRSVRSRARHLASRGAHAWRHLPFGHRVRIVTPVLGTAAAIALLASPLPALPSSADVMQAYAVAHAQAFEVPASASPLSVSDRDAYEGTAGFATLREQGTNYDWATMILLKGGWPVTDDSVTAIVRWMRQENGTDNWWNRNNPLNNGWGASGGSFLGGYADLEDAAANVADAIHTLPGYSGILAALSSGASTSTIEHAIWASTWATSHYANGSHWSSAEVPRVKSPSGTWG